jgi:serine/threonine protein kinase
MVVFYIVTKGQHAFGQEADRLRNLLDGNPVGVERLEDPSLKDLLSWMLSQDPGERPSAEEALHHPYLQSKKNRFEMLCKVGNQPEIKKRSDGTSDVVSQLNNDPINWESKLRTKIFNHFTMQRKIKYNTNEWKDCLRLMRNVNQHWFDDRPKTDPEVLNDVGTLYEYFLTLFPDFPVKVHRIIRSCDWKEREELKEYFK